LSTSVSNGVNYFLMFMKNAVFLRFFNSIWTDVHCSCRAHTHVWQKLGGWCNLTMTTKYKYGNGLTPSAPNRPAFPSAKR